MAAGRYSHSRKRYTSYCKDETHLYKKGYHQNTSSRGRDNWTSDRTVSSVTSYNHVRKNGISDTSIHKACGAGYGGGSLGGTHDGELHGRREKDPVSESGAGTVSVKKRKFSPIVWDRDVKKANVPSKNGIHATSPVSSRPSPPKSAKAFKGIPDVADVRSERCSPNDELQISPVDSLVSNVSDGSEQNTHDGKGQEKMEEGEFAEEPNLSKSKWAYEDSPRVSEVHNSSPESEEFKGGSSEGNGVVTSSSAEAGHFIASASRYEHSDDELHSKAVMEIDDDGCSMGYYSSEDDDDSTTQAAELPKQSGFCAMHGCRNVFEFERLDKISEGTYGVVYKARDKKTGDIVALKKVKKGRDREGFPLTALREINILGALHHPSIVEVKEVVVDDFDGVYMVMEYIDHELKGFMDSMKQPFSQSEVKCLMIQLLEGLSYLHDSWVIHRDLKTSNLLLNNNGELKICDFGMARKYGSPLKPYTSLVVTLWYRAPEVLLGTKQYSTAIDMWSVGCIMAELLSKKPLFDGNRELEQIDKIFRTLGTPNDKIWPGYSKLPGVKPNFVKQPFNNLRKQFRAATFFGSPVLTELGFDLLNKLLTYDPSKRIIAEEALNHGWFREAPLPAEHIKMCR